MTKADFIQYVQNWRTELVDGCGFDVLPLLTVNFDNRVRSLGRCHKREKRNYAILTFSEELLNLIDDDDNGGFECAREVVLHELCHAIRGNVGHGSRFKMYANEINIRYGASIATKLSKDNSDVWRETMLKNGKYKYLITCDCGRVHTYKTRKCGIVNNPERYYCKTCGYTLKVEEL